MVLYKFSNSVFAKAAAKYCSCKKSSRAAILVVIGVNNNNGIQHDRSAVGGVDCISIAVGGSRSAIRSYEFRRIGGVVNNAVGYCSATPQGASIKFS